MRLPLLWKILLTTLLPVVAFALLGITTNLLSHRAHRVARQAHYLAHQESEAELGRRLIAIAQTTAAVVRAEDVALLQPGDESSRTYRRLQATLQRIARQAGARRLYLFDRSRKSLCDAQTGVAIGAVYYHLDVERALLRQVFRKGTGASMLFVGKDRVEYKTGFAPLTDDHGRVVAAIAVEGSADTFVHLRRLDAQLRSLRVGLLRPLTVWLLVGAGLLLLVGASVVLARSVTRPVRHLMAAAAAIGRGELDTPIVPRSRDELGVLAQAMNHMRADLAARQQEMQLMLSGIAHEVRNPLGGMELFAGLLHDEVADEPARREMVERIQRELEHLERVVSEFLDYARHSPLARAHVDLGPWCADLVGLCQGDAAAREVTLRLEEPPALGASIDAEKLRRALLNVVRNAIWATPAGGQVTLTLRETHGAIVIACRDTGRGIAPADLDKIFNAFYTTRERGTGLGLALAHKIVSAHGGRIEVDSTLGEGTEVRLILPRQEAAGAPAPSSEER